MPHAGTAKCSCSCVGVEIAPPEGGCLLPGPGLSTRAPPGAQTTGSSSGLRLGPQARASGSGLRLRPWGCVTFTHALQHSNAMLNKGQVHSVVAAVGGRHSDLLSTSRWLLVLGQCSSRVAKSVDRPCLAW